MAIGVANLWDITDELMQLLNVNKGSATFTVTDRAPDEVRSLPDETYLSLYLFHVGHDKFQRNATSIPPVPNAEKITRALKTPHHPLSLDLYYLLTAYAKGVQASRLEQQALTAALKCFHEHPIIRHTTLPDIEFTITLAPETADSLGRLWQAVTSSLRLSAIYKVSVVFIDPPEPPAPAKPVETVNLAVSLTTLPFAKGGQVISTYIKVNYVAPGNPNTNKQYELVPAVVAPGQEFILYGAEMNQSSSDHVYLIQSDGTEQDVTAWVSDATSSRLILMLPTTGGPAAGIYQLRVGNANGEPLVTRSNATPFSIAAWVEPTGGPILSASGSTYTLNGQGFSPGDVEVHIGTLPLDLGGGSAPGQFVVSSSTEISFQLPDTLSVGVHSVRVRVNQVESPPAKWVVKTG